MHVGLAINLFGTTPWEPSHGRRYSSFEQNRQLSDRTVAVRLLRHLYLGGGLSRQPSSVLPVHLRRPRGLANQADVKS